MLLSQMLEQTTVMDQVDCGWTSDATTVPVTVLQTRTPRPSQRVRGRPSMRHTVSSCRMLSGSSASAASVNAVALAVVSVAAACMIPTWVTARSHCSGSVLASALAFKTAHCQGCCLMLRFSSQTP